MKTSQAATQARVPTDPGWIVIAIVLIVPWVEWLWLILNPPS